MLTSCDANIARDRRPTIAARGLQGQVQAIEGRVAALERMSVQGGGKSSSAGHHTKDSWSGG